MYYRASLAVLALTFAYSSPALSQDATAASPYAFERGYPTPEATQKVRADALLQRALVAYRFWYPTVSVEGIFQGNRNVGIEDGKQWGIASTGPRQVGFTLNSDTPYGSGVLDLSNGPMVIELPEGAFIGLVDDHNQGWVQDMGLPGPDKGKGGKHLVLPPGYDGSVPEGYFVGRSTSIKNLIALRALPVGGDVKKALDGLRSVKIYPLAQADNPKPLEVIETTEKAMDSSSLRWEDNLQFWQILHGVIDAETANPAFLPMYGLLAELGIEKGKPFNPDDRTKAVLEQAARQGRDQMLVSAFDSDRPDRKNWPDRQWEWAGLVADNAQFETPAGIDLEARDRWFAQAIVASPAMFRRDAGAGSLYWLGARDSSGAYLDGGKNYRLTIPQPVPGKLFWSVTVYDSATRSQVQTDQDKAALRSLFELKDVKGSQPLSLFFGPEQPKDSENRWIKTSPGKGWFAYIRIYGPEQAAFDKSWTPGDFEAVAP
ncbi:DUF1254 domain-containing protein [Ensifer sp. ENS05]|uniref:DUF1254 domain-containing protein n=1 Tax=Ensifer sp. ENS05 TaxID=2769277 RepID=UPI00177AB5AE|nr:DUF1254 domain-containing protein [Ensifer sp. ENS05]MBD9597513.1 DUF1254 domain-containing protein [Ensifer sp. ENS05]